MLAMFIMWANIEEHHKRKKKTKEITVLEGITLNIVLMQFVAVLELKFSCGKRTWILQRILVNVKISPLPIMETNIENKLASQKFVK